VSGEEIPIGSYLRKVRADKQKGNTLGFQKERYRHLRKLHGTWFTNYCTMPTKLLTQSATRQRRLAKKHSKPNSERKRISSRSATS
jgi:hypothetical protein